MNQIDIKTDLWMKNLAFASIFIICLSVFVSLSVSALHHILLIVPGIYFLIKRRTSLSPSMWALLAVCVSILISVVFNWSDFDRPLKNLSSMKYFLVPLLGVFALRQVKWSEKRIKILIYLIMFATSVATISGIIGLYSGYNPLKMKAACHDSRACGLYGMYMTYGYGIGLFMVLMTGLVIYRDQLKHLINTKVVLFAWLINAAGLYLSYARGAWLGFLIALPFFFLKINKKIFFLVFIVGGLILGSLVTFSPKVNEMFFERQGSNNERLAFFETAWVAFKEKPIVGWGYKNFEPNVIDLKSKYEIAYPQFQGHAHNNFLEHLASTGILGFLALLAFHFVWAKESLCSKRVIDHIALPFVIALAVSGMTQVTLGDGENLFLIMAFWAMTRIKTSESAVV